MFPISSFIVCCICRGREQTPGRPVLFGSTASWWTDLRGVGKLSGSSCQGHQGWNGNSHDLVCQNACQGQVWTFLGNNEGFDLVILSVWKLFTDSCPTNKEDWVIDEAINVCFEEKCDNYQKYPREKCYLRNADSVCKAFWTLHKFLRKNLILEMTAKYSCNEMLIFIIILLTSQVHVVLRL